MNQRPLAPHASTLPDCATSRKQKSQDNKILAFCDRDRIRTCDRLLRRQMLYPAELRDHSSKMVSFPENCSFFVGVAGFEPATSCSQSRRDNRATLHPEFAERPGFEPGQHLRVDRLAICSITTLAPLLFLMNFCNNFEDANVIQ